MLYHLQPRCYSEFRSVVLIDAVFPAFGLSLRDGRELATGRPYPNRCYSVGCRKNPRRKAYEGFLIEAAAFDVFTAVYRWGIEASVLGIHTVEYRLADQTFDAVSDNSTLWYAQGRFESRLLDTNQQQPRFTFSPNNQEIQRATERFTLPTIERAQFEEIAGDRFPPLDSAFQGMPAASR